MSKLRYIFYCLFLVSIMSSCYEDKGNYTYKKLSEISFENYETTYYLDRGDIAKISMDLKFSGSEIKDLSYEWILNTYEEYKVISTEKDLNYDTSELPEGDSFRLMYKVTDDKTEAYYSITVYLKIKTQKSDGWVFLTKNSNGYDLSLISKYIEEETEKVTYDPKENVYSLSNGENISGISKKLLPRYYYGSDTDVRVLIINSEGNIEVGIEDYKKLSNTNDYFLDGNIPDNFEPKDELYLDYYSFLIGESGEIYSRKFEDNYYAQSGRYSPYPVYLEKGINISQVIYTPYTGLYDAFAVLYDSANRRFLFVNDKDGSIITFDYNADGEVSNIGDLRKDLVFAQFHNMDDWGDKGFFYSILKDDSGRLYSYYFCYYGYYKRMESASEVLLDDGGIITDESEFCLFRGRDYLLISNNDKLYLHDIKINDVPKLFYDFGGRRITNIKKSFDSELVGITLDTGEFVILRVNNRTISDMEDKVVYTYEFTDREIVDFMFMCSSPFYFGYGD